MAGIALVVSLMMLTLPFCSIPYVVCYEYQVGGSRGWAVPPANDSKIYNDWASENRFRPNDVLWFKYTKDSVMAVTEAEYKGCNSSRPAFFSNNGNSLYSLNHSGAFYFISGVSGHCFKGQRMVVKVLSSDESQTGGGGGSSRSSAANFSPSWALKLASVIPLIVACFLSEPK
ncbi:hypothetical protein MLD38_000133 [Melastoma candidum]|uniref:Uncharacterized protein n=1 Tax=Melastoma candidum TaxID=119954 RepID=A0ACB9SE10_9MYRT|nr:hypothetical protein MLD38_000133 [Melastoma candidum]